MFLFTFISNMFESFPVQKSYNITESECLTDNLQKENCL